MTTAQPVAGPPRRAWLVLVAAMVLLYGFLLGTRGLNEPDESRYAAIALAMTRPGGDWWEPRMSGYGHYDKPPLIYWATALSFRAFGVNEWAARLPSLLGAFLALGGLGWTAYRLRGPWAAWWAVLVCGTSAQFWVFGRILSPDMLLTGWCTLAVAAWAEGRAAEGSGQEGIDGRRGRGGSWGWWLGSLACWALAWWTKATPTLVPLLGLTAGVVIIRDRAGLRALRPWRLFPAVILLGAPWYLSMLRSYPELEHFFFARELAGRLVGRAVGRHGSWWYYGPVSAWGWLPWWPVAAWVAWRARGRLFGGPARTVLTAWTQRLGVEGWLLLVGLASLSATSSKLASYTLTLAPWAALLVGRAVVRVAVLPSGGFRRAWLAPAAAFALVAGVGIATLPPRWERRLGTNTSLREVSRFLRRQGATRVDTDRYWPGLEFYLGRETVHYVLRIDGLPSGTDDPGAACGRDERYRERDSDPGVPPDEFVFPERWPSLPPGAAVPRAGGGWWFVRFYRRPKLLVDQALQTTDPARRPVEVRRIGDFDVYRLPEGP